MNHTYDSLMRAVHLQARRKSAVGCMYGVQRYDSGDFELWRFLANEGEYDPLIGISAGLHGNEVAGPLCLKHGLEGIISYAASAGMGVIVYPCLNPSGFERNQRYNEDDEKPNNDFLRYKTRDGRWIDDAGSDKSKVREWCWSNDPRVIPCPAQETRQAVADLCSLYRREILCRVKAWIDLHQDPDIKGPGSYAYVYGDRKRFVPITRQVSHLVPLLSNRRIDSGYENKDSPILTDSNGLLTRYDGSIADLMDNLGVPISITVETTTVIPLADALKVNWVWVKGVIDVVAGGLMQTVKPYLF